MRLVFEGGPANGETMWTENDPGDLLVPPGQPGNTPPYARAGTTQDDAGPLVHYRFTGDDPVQHASPEKPILADDEF